MSSGPDDPYNTKLATDSQDSDDLSQQLASNYGKVITFSADGSKSSKNVKLTSKGVENAKKRLRAFSIQKKSSLSPVSAPKPATPGVGTVFIGKLGSAKTIPKPEPPDPSAEQKKPPKPPKPGTKPCQESYVNTQKKTLAEIEDMKRQMELVELGIPLGLICPAPNSDKAMPTKAMPPIKSFIDPSKVDELIREAKKAKAEGKKFKFDYHKLLPDYDNPFQRKKEDVSTETKSAETNSRKKSQKDRRSDKYDSRRHTGSKNTEYDRFSTDKQKDARESDAKSRDKNAKSRERDARSRDSNAKSRDRDGKSRHGDAKSRERDAKSRDKDTKPRDRDAKSRDKDVKYRDRDSKRKDRDNKSKDRDLKSIERDTKSKERDLKKADFRFSKDSQRDEKEAHVNLEDFVVCDSWSENGEKSKDSTPIPEEKQKPTKENTPIATILDPMEQLKEILTKKDKPTQSPNLKTLKLKPVTDSIEFEIDPNEDDIMDMFDENSPQHEFSNITSKKDYDSPDLKLYDYEMKDDLDDMLADMADDTFLESVINEIKQGEMDEMSQDKVLVEYDESPSKDSKDDELRDSVTPEMDEKVKELHSTLYKVREMHSSRSDYSDGYKSVESGKSAESGYKSTDSLKLSESIRSDCESMNHAEGVMAKYTVDSLETWSFVLKICQPLLFRHDKNKCYRETQSAPKLWYTENTKHCTCVIDRRVVYQELEMCKMELVDSLYNVEPVQEAAYPTARGWYPNLEQSLAESNTVQISSEWEAEDSQTEQLPATPERRGDISLDKEYQRFMEAVWPEVAESKSETPRSSPVRRGKKRADDQHSDTQKVKKIKLASDGWSQESDVNEEVAKKSYNGVQHFLFEALHFNPNPKIVSKKVKVDKEKRKRKHSTSTSMTDSSESDAKRRKKMQKKKDDKKSKAKEAKRRRIIKKSIKKLKGKQRKKKKLIKIVEESNIQDLERENKKREKKTKKKKLLKQKKKHEKKKKARAKSSSPSSASSSDSEMEPEKKSKKKQKSSEKKKRKKSLSESQEELFDVNILNNIKTERLTDDEKANQMEFSPRRQKPREIIDVKELQNDFVGNSIQIKKEIEEEDQKNVEQVREDKKEDVSVEILREDSLESRTDNVVQDEPQQESKEQDESQSALRPDESNISQSSSQESIYSLKDQPLYEKDESHLRPSSQNSNYSFHDVMASGMYSKNLEHEIEQVQRHDMRRHDSHGHDMQSLDVKSYDMKSQDTQSRDTQSQDIQRHDVKPSMQSQDIQRHDVKQSMQSQDIQRHDVKQSMQSQDIQRHDVKQSMQSQDIQRHDVNQTMPSKYIQRHDVQTPVIQRDAEPRQDFQGREDQMHAEKRHEEQRDDMQRRDVQGHIIQRLEEQRHDVQRIDVQRHDHEIDLHSQENYVQGDYEMYEQMAMAYQSGVASQQTSPPGVSGEQRIETVVHARTRGEIKCDWRAGDSLTPAAPAATPAAPAQPQRPSRWGLKPGDVNIVLTGGNEQFPIRNVVEPVYKIQSIANRTDNSASGYDEAYMDTYGALDKLQYGDCFSTNVPVETTSSGADDRRAAIGKHSTTLDDRIDLALRTTVLGNVARDEDDTDDKDGPEKGILVTKSLGVSAGRGAKRVSFADGYKPGQDSDVEDPPVKKKKKSRRLGCAWPCPATHPDHIPLWDALPPPPPPPGSPPPPALPPPPATHLLRQPRPGLSAMPGLFPPPHQGFKFDPNSMPAFMPPEPPPGIISFQPCSLMPPRD